MSTYCLPMRKKIATYHLFLSLLLFGMNLQKVVANDFLGASLSTCDTTIQVSAVGNGTGLCLAPNFQLEAPSLAVIDEYTTCLPMTMQVFTDIPIAFLQDGANVPFPALPHTLTSMETIHVLPGLGAGLYYLRFEKTDCDGNISNCLYAIQVLPTMVCNTNLFFTLDPSCAFEITPDMILESQCASDENYKVSIEGETSNLINSIGIYTVSIEYIPLFDHDSNPLTPGIPIPSGYSCWGTITVEDKTGPSCSVEEEQITVFCTEAPIAISPTYEDCTGVDTDTTFYDTTIGACSFLETTDFSLPIDDGNGFIQQFLPELIPFPTNIPSGFSLDHVVIRTWQISDILGNEALPCQQYFYHWRPQSVVVPTGTLEIVCNTGTLAQNLADIDATYVPHFMNPAYVPGAGQAPYFPILPNSHDICKYSATYEDTPVDGFCGNTFKFIREWRVLNWCTNELQTSEQIIKLIDTIPPEIICPEDFTVAADIGTCSANVSIPIFTATDTCSDSIAYAHFWAFGSGQSTYMNVSAGTHLITYVATDACGNASSCTSEITITDGTYPVAVCEQITELSITEFGMAAICADDIDSGSYDNCSDIVREISIMGSNEFSPCLEFECTDVTDTVRIILQVTDAEGLSNQCMVIVNVVDKIPPNIQCPYDVTIQCTDNLVDTSTMFVPSVLDNCTTDLRFQDIKNLDACNTGTITRTWIVFDQSFNQSSCQQTIYVEDNTPPSIQFSGDTTLFCNGLDNSFGQPTIEDDCSLYGVAHTDIILVDEPCFQKVQRTWIVQGECDGSEIAQSMFIKIELDETAPVFENPPLDTTISCNQAIPFSEPTIMDTCSEELDIEFLETETNAGCPYNRIITRTWSATDDCGNNNILIQNIKIVDTLGPVINGLVLNLQLQCDEPIPNDAPTISDNCTPIDSIAVVFMEQIQAGDCPQEQVIIRTWTATDLCGNANSLVQTINITDTEIPTFINVPQDTIILCNAPLPEVSPAVRDNCTDGIPLTFSEIETPGLCSQERTITRTWTAEDACGNIASVQQVIAVIDDTPPIFTNQANDITLGCNDIIPLFTPLVEDDCGTDFSIIETQDTTGTACDLTITRTWTAGDACGNTSTLQQVVRILDNTPPIISGILNIDSDQFVNCSEFLNLPTPMATDDCSENLDVTMNIDFYSDGIIYDSSFIRNDTLIFNGNPSGEYPLGRHIINYSSVDDCGNERLSIAIINIKDVRPPISGCFNLELELNADSTVSISADELINLSATFDNCTDIYFEFGEQFPEIMLLGDTITFDCDDLGINNYSIYIEDAFGNYDFCGNVLNIVDPFDFCNLATKQAIIAGKIYTEYQNPVSNTGVRLNETGHSMSMTDVYGSYFFENIEDGTTCSVEPQSPADFLNGVTTFDLVMIQRHILGIQVLHSPYKLIAADVNHSGNISTADIIDLRQNILNIQSSFPNNDSWRYLDANYVLKIQAILLKK